MGTPKPIVHNLMQIMQRKERKRKKFSFLRKKVEYLKKMGYSHPQDRKRLIMKGSKGTREFMKGMKSEHINAIAEVLTPLMHVKAINHSDLTIMAETRMIKALKKLEKILPKRKKKAVFRELLKSREPVIEEFAVWAQAKLKDKTTIPIIEKKLKSSNPHTAINAIFALTEMNSKKSAKKIEQLLDTHFPSDLHVEGLAITSALAAMKKMGKNPDAKKLTWLLSHPMTEARLGAIDMLDWAANSKSNSKLIRLIFSGKEADKIEKTVSKMLESKNPFEKAMALQLLSLAGRKPTIFEMNRYLKDKNPLVRASAVIKAYMLYGKTGKELGMELMHDKNADVRAATITAAFSELETEAMAEILMGLNDKSPNVRRVSARYVGLIAIGLAKETMKQKNISAELAEDLELVKTLLAIALRDKNSKIAGEASKSYKIYQSILRS